MPKKEVVITHVYEFTFRVSSQQELDLSDIPYELERHVTSILCGKGVDKAGVGPVLYHEMCFDESEGHFCHLTEGHRGRHESVIGKRWGTDL